MPTTLWGGHITIQLRFLGFTTSFGVGFPKMSHSNQDLKLGLRWYVE